jgi:hypothetical protein
MEENNVQTDNTLKKKLVELDGNNNIIIQGVNNSNITISLFDHEKFEKFKNDLKEEITRPTTSHERKKQIEEVERELKEIIAREFKKVQKTRNLFFHGYPIATIVLILFLIFFAIFQATWVISNIRLIKYTLGSKDDFYKDECFNCNTRDSLCDKTVKKLYQMVDKNSLSKLNEYVINYNNYVNKDYIDSAKIQIRILELKNVLKEKNIITIGNIIRKYQNLNDSDIYRASNYYAYRLAKENPDCFIKEIWKDSSNKASREIIKALKDSIDISQNSFTNKIINVWKQRNSNLIWTMKKDKQYFIHDPNTNPKSDIRGQYEIKPYGILFDKKDTAYFDKEKMQIKFKNNNTELILKSQKNEN